MSDAMWDMEYNKAYDLKQEIIELCNKKDIEIPKFKCIRGAFGKEDGTVIEHQTQTECYNCTRFKVREGAMLTVNMKEEEIKRTKRQIRELATKLRELED